MPISKFGKQAKPTAAGLHELNALALHDLAPIAKRLLPNGWIKGRCWHGRHTVREGATGRDARIEVITIDIVDGSWKNHRTGVSGSQMTSLIGHLTGLDPLESYAALKQLLGKG